MGQYTVYKSTDGSAPTLSGTAGDLTTLLDAVLVNGYGAKAAAGWTITHTALNKRVYTQGAGSGFGFRIRDNAGGTGGAQEALIRGAESWTDIDTPVDPFPTDAQSAITDDSQVIRKSSAASATTRVWKVFADDRTCMLFIASGDTASEYKTCMFGDFDSYVVGDAYGCLLVARTTENSGLSTAEYMGRITASIATSGGHFVARDYGGVGKSIACAQHGDSLAKNSGTAGLKGSIAWFNGPDGGLYVSPLHIHESSGPHIRGKVRGLYYPHHAITNFNDGDTFSGAGDYAGKTFEFVKLIYEGTSATQGAFAIETSATLS